MFIEEYDNLGPYVNDILNIMGDSKNYIDAMLIFSEVHDKLCTNKKALFIFEKDYKYKKKYNISSILSIWEKSIFLIYYYDKYSSKYEIIKVKDSYMLLQLLVEFKGIRDTIKYIKNKELKI